MSSQSPSPSSTSKDDALIKLHEMVEDDTKGEAFKFSRSNEIKEHIDSIRSMLGSMGDGEISISAYDTAWVALVEDIHGSGTPQFPSTLQWIANNQLMDGSWGDNQFFCTHERMLNTLACVVALKTWNIYPDKFEKGMSFIRGTICNLENEKDGHMPVGFELAFGSLLEKAWNLDIGVPQDSPVLQEIYTQRNLKLTKLFHNSYTWIPKDILQKVPTVMLFSLEIMPADLDWEKLLKLQCQGGSFLFSPSSTAFALLQTKDENCLTYLSEVVERFNGGAPTIYPVDMFEHIWVVDRLQRLGISRYFEPEIKECIDYVHRYWNNENGICWARNTLISDIDDTCMGFRLLRLHGHDVSSDVFKQFEKGGEFFTIAGQPSKAISGIFNLYRASQVLFPGETILEDARKFCSQFLREKQACNQLLDKWIIEKDLPGEVGYALDIPWYASLPRVEARLYIEQYGGEDDVWIGKSFYRMPYVNNNFYSELAKLDFNKCQALHQLEWNMIQKWCRQGHLEEFGINNGTLLLAYFLAAANIFEPERSVQRLAWTKTAVLIEAVASYFNKETSIEQKRAFLLKFGAGTTSGGDCLKINGRSNLSKTGEELVGMLLTTLNQLSLEAQEVHSREICHLLHQTWQMWLTKHLDEGDRYQGEAELLVLTINLCAGHSLTEEVLNHPLHKHLSHLTNKICHQLGPFHLKKEHNGSYKPQNDSTVDLKLESDMQELVQLVLGNSPDGINPEIKRTFLMVAKSFYYAAYCDLPTISSHIEKVLFECVV